MRRDALFTPLEAGTYRVYQQRHPVGVRREQPDGPPLTEYTPNLVEVGKVEAYSGREAIALARELPSFRYASRTTLLAFPIVQRERRYG